MGSWLWRRRESPPARLTVDHAHLRCPAAQEYTQLSHELLPRPPGSLRRWGIIPGHRVAFAARHGSPYECSRGLRDFMNILTWARPESEGL